MSFTETRPPSLAASQAHTLLQAWVCGDLARLRAELDSNMFIFAAADSYPDSEQLTLLKSVVCQMRRCRDLYAERTSDPQLGLCVDLLVHLASSRTLVD